VHKVGEGRPNVVDRIASGKVRLVLNTPQGRKAKADEKAIRLAAMEQGVTCITTLPGAMAAVCGIEAMKAGAFEVRALQDIAAGVAEERSSRAR
jgi:carbamoyl-phosphate synthase large subunit